MSAIAAAKKRQEDAIKKQNGELAPDVDQDGKMINPHNPDFITRVPWYLGLDQVTTLKHHKMQKVDHFLSMTETDQLIESKLKTQQDLKKQTSKTVFRKGACKNCGATTHKEKDCVERPRSAKKSAWKSGLDIAADEVSLNFESHGKVSYSAKRDQWQGYNPDDYTTVIDKFDRVEEERRRVKQEMKEKKRMEEEEEKKRLKREERSKRKAESAQEGREKSSKSRGTPGNDDDDDDGDDKASESDAGSDTDSDSDYDSDEDDDDEDDTKEFIEKDEDAVDFQARLARQGGVGGAEMKVTARNLRIREDTPKYLRNLELTSAHYDPKSRSMRANPFPNENPENLVFAGDNFVRYSGDALKLASTQVACWEMQAHGEAVDVISNPSQAEIMHKQIKEKKKSHEDSKVRAIIDKYGGDEYKKPLDPRIRLGQTESYSEYSWDGRVVKGAGKVIPRSKYEEDVLVNNHTTVWGSYFNRHHHAWGFACCHSLLRNSYCTGAVGRAANDAANSAIDSNQANQLLQSQVLAKKEKEKVVAFATSEGAGPGLTKRSDLFGEDGGASKELDPEAMRLALKRASEWERRDHTTEADDRRRSYNSMKSVEVGMEDMEAYRMKKVKRDDPMAAFLDNEE